MDLTWPLLIIAGFLEPVWVYTMERSDNFRKIQWTVATVVVTAVDLYLLSIAMQSLGPGLSYAIWTGIGAVATFLMGIFVFKESASCRRAFFIFLIIGGIIGLNLVSGGVI